MSNPATQSAVPPPPITQLQGQAQRAAVDAKLATASQNGNLHTGQPGTKEGQKQEESRVLMASAIPQSQARSSPPSGSQEPPPLRSAGKADEPAPSKVPVFPGHGNANSALTSIAPAPEKQKIVSAHSRVSEKAPRAKRRRLTGAGKRWSSAADQFIKEIPPVPCFSDPKRQVPMRDMRGWISTIAKSSQKLVWDRFMGELRQVDFADGGDLDVCRYILASVIHEAQDPKSLKTQTRQAVNNAIKRELSLPKAAGQQGRGQTFRELFRSKATQAGFIVSAIVDIAVSQFVDEDITMDDRGVVGRSPFSGSPIARSIFHARTPMTQPVIHELRALRGYGKREDDMAGIDGEGPSAGKWRCPRTDAGERAYWKSQDLITEESLRLFISWLVNNQRIHDLKRILVDFRWIRNHVQKCNHDILHLVKHGYDVLLAVKTPAMNVFEREGYRLIRNALMLIRPVLWSSNRAATSRDGENLDAQLATQLYGRLLKSSIRFAVISTLLESIRMHADRPWLRPLHPCFESPKTDIAIAIRRVGAVSSAIAMSDDGQLVVTADGDYKVDTGRSVRVWDISSGECVSRINGHPNATVVCLAITPNKKHVVSGSGSELMFSTILDDKKRFIPKVSTKAAGRKTGRESLVISLAVLPDSKRAVVVHEDVIRVWNISRGTLEKEFDKNLSTIYSLDVTRDGKFVVSGDKEGKISIWSISSGKKENSFSNGTGASVFCVSLMVSEESSDDAEKCVKIAAGSRGSLNVWSLPHLGSDVKVDDHNRKSVAGNKFSEVTFNSIRCTRTGTIFSGSDDGVVRMWKLEDNDAWRAIDLLNDEPERLHTPEYSRKGSSLLTAIGVSNDGTKVASSTAQSVVPVWDVGQYEETIRVQKGVLDQPYFPYERGTVCFTDMYKGEPVAAVDSHGMRKPRQKDLAFYFDMHADDEVSIVKQGGTPGNVLDVLLRDKGQRWISFDEDIEDRRCGQFLSPHISSPIKRKGVGVKFMDGSLAFFEVELDPLHRGK